MIFTTDIFIYVNYIILYFNNNILMDYVKRWIVAVLIAKKMDCSSINC